MRTGKYTINRLTIDGHPIETEYGELTVSAEETVGVVHALNLADQFDIDIVRFPHQMTFHADGHGAVSGSFKVLSMGSIRGSSATYLKIGLAEE